MSCNCRHVMGYNHITDRFLIIDQIKEWDKGGDIPAKNIHGQPHYTFFIYCPSCGDNISDIIEELAA